MQNIFLIGAFNPLDHGRWFRLFTQNFIFFTTKWRTLINITFGCGQKVCLCVFWQTQRRNLKLVKCNLKYEKFWSVFLFNSTSSDETCKALTYNKFLISCCVQPKLVSAPLFSMVGNPLLQFFWMDTKWYIKLSWSSKVCEFWSNHNSNAVAQQAYWVWIFYYLACLILK